MDKIENRLRFSQEEWSVTVEQNNKGIEFCHKAIKAKSEMGDEFKLREFIKKNYHPDLYFLNDDIGFSIEDLLDLYSHSNAILTEDQPTSPIAWLEMERVINKFIANCFLHY